MLNRFEKATNGRCLSCQRLATDRIVGLGDLVALSINLTPAWRLKPLLNKGPKGCGCDKRQKSLNKAVPIKRAKPVVHETQGQVYKTKSSCGCK
jgi:hypothetical protein